MQSFVHEERCVSRDGFVAWSAPAQRAVGVGWPSGPRRRSFSSALAGFADKVIRLLTDHRFAEELGRNGQRSVTERYPWQVSGQVLDEALHTLIRSTTSTTAL